MKNICSRSDCTGCGLCVAQCPQKCISLQKGLLGHLYPKVNEEQCIDCGLCKRNCPSLNPVGKKKAKIAFAAWAKDESEYRSSTSGGAASVFSRFILENNGIVYGCAMLPGLKVKHIRIDNVNDLALLKGSKYVQSSIVESISQIKEDIKQGKRVLFIGLPCQNAAVKKSFKTQPNNLILIDLICHGVPSYDWLKTYIQKKIKLETFDFASFRDKDGQYALSIFSNKFLIYYKKLWGQHRYKDLYLNTFIDGYTCRKSCNNCKYAYAERVSDITIGDFWGLGKRYSASEIPEHPYGISLILPNTEKGLNLLENNRNLFNIYERTIEEAVSGNDQLQGPQKATVRIKIFRKIHKIFGIGFSYYLCELDHVLRHKLRWLIKGRILKKLCE